MLLNEDSLQAGDLRDTVSHIFEIDHFRSKMGDDKDVVVLSFTVESLHPAEDLVDFIEKGYQFVLDADMSPGELKNGKYKVFVEIERNKDIAENVNDLLYGLKKLVSLENFKFRYHKSFNSIPADVESLKENIPHDADSYEKIMQEKDLSNADKFFNNSMLESVKFQEDLIEFKKIYAQPLLFKIIKSGSVKEILESINQRIAVDYKDIAEVMFLTKYLGNYNITKIGNQFMFENKNHSILMEKL